MDYTINVKKQETECWSSIPYFISKEPRQPMNKIQFDFLVLGKLNALLLAYCAYGVIILQFNVMDIVEIQNPSTL